MKFTRRSALAGIGSAAIAAGLGAELTGCARVGTALHASRDHASIEPPSDTQFLDRASFGWSPEEDVAYRKGSHLDYVQIQLDAGQDEPLHLKLQLSQLDCLRLEGPELMDLPKAKVLEQLQAAALLRAIYSPNQLRERMVDFWSNHFNIYSGKADGAFFKGHQEQSIIRQHSLGSFGEMAREMTRSTAMLVYLDNQLNSKERPNENYARELLELHTLGVYGGYTQTDIQEVARCLTGWTMETGFLRPKGKFKFNRAAHDDGVKTVLNTIIPAGGGEKDGDKVMDILLAHPSTPRHLARKLVTYFCGAANPDLEAEVAAKYDNIASMVRPILGSDWISSAPTRIRRPMEFMAAAIRYSGASTDAGGGVQEHLRNMGQLAYEWPMPDGYPVDELSWNANMLPRWKFAIALANDEISGTTLGQKERKRRNADTNDTALMHKLLSPQFQSA